MAEKAEQIEGMEEHERDGNPFIEAVRKVLLASIGAFALAQEEVEDFVNRLIERGEIAEKDGRKLVSEIMEKRKKRSDMAEDEVNKRIDSVLQRMNVPTKADIDSLSKKINDLSKKVDELKKES